MKKIGILGGTSPESTVPYYAHITRAYTARFGDWCNREAEDMLLKREMSWCP